MLPLNRSWRVPVMLAAALVATAASSAHAGFTYNLVSDSATRDITYGVPVVATYTDSLGALYTSGGMPTVTTDSSTGAITFDFTAGLSASYKAKADGLMYLAQDIKAKFVLDIQFDTPTSITASIFEGGVFSRTGDAGVSVDGGEFIVQALSASPESRAAELEPVFGTGWTATAETTPFSGAYTGYRIVVDNDLSAWATDRNSSSSIAKKSFLLTVTPGGGGVPPTPEPTSLGILGLGIAGLLVRRRR